MDQEGIRPLRILMFIAALILCAPAHAEEPGGFRGMIWGVTKDDVKKFERAKFYKEEGARLYYLEKPDHFRRLITYDFTDGKLTGGKFEYVELHVSNPKTIMDMFGQKQIEFEKIYGKPTAEEFSWKNKKYRYYPEFWYRALRSGDLRMRAVWQTGDSRIALETYHDGLFYQLYYTATAGTFEKPKNNGIALDLPGAAPDTKNQPDSP